MIVINKERTQAHGIVGRNRGVVLRALRSDDRGGSLSGGSIGFTHATDCQQENREARPHRHILLSVVSTAQIRSIAN
jgi:hypothetical protein